VLPGAVAVGAYPQNGEKQMFQQNNEKVAAASNSGIASQTIEQPTKAFSTELKPFPTSYPGGITPETLFDKRTERIIAAQADQMIASGLFMQSERGDAENELRIILAYEMVKYDPSRDRYTFTATILAKRAVTEIIRRSRELRDNPCVISLDAPITEDANTRLIDLISSEEYAAAWNNSVDARKRKRLEKGVASFLGKLSPIDRKICKKLMLGKGIREIGRRLQLSHNDVLYRLHNIITSKAIECGLDKVFGGDEA